LNTAIVIESCVMPASVRDISTPPPHPDVTGVGKSRPLLRLTYPEQVAW
jgi:hypothetical protein